LLDLPNGVLVVGPRGILSFPFGVEDDFLPPHMTMLKEMYSLKSNKFVVQL